LQNNQYQVAPDLGQMACTLSQNDRAQVELLIDVTEQWVSEGLRKGLRFKCSNIRFLVHTRGDGPTLQFRLEWVGRELDADGGLIYTGKEAAHPHWQFDTNPSWTIRSTPADEIVDVSLPQLDYEDIELDLENLDANRMVDNVVSTDPFKWFHRLHLPARATWHDSLRSIPGDATGHQHEPQDTEELDRWLLSALRYMRYEFQKYS
jgi:hypothetical protein